MATLYDQMKADGATFLYKFNESSGNILNSGSTEGLYDFTAVSGNMTRQVAGRTGPDVLALRGAVATQAAPTYGHAQVPSRPNLHGNTTFSLEVVAMVPTNVFSLVVDMDTGNGFTMSSIYSDGTGSLKGTIGTIPNPINTGTFSLDPTTINSTYWHAVLTWDGDRHKGYFNGALVYNNDLLNGGIYNDSAGVVSSLAVLGAVNDNTVNSAGKIDVLGIYTGHVLTAAEVTAHYGLLDVLGGGAFYFDRYILNRRRS